ncbi:hypothetical protein [Saccharibacillus brassicae]|nr:hypothetical protein [Saccharibacillus brassicae]
MTQKNEKDPKELTGEKKSMTLEQAMKLSKDRYGEAYKRLSKS